MSTYEKKELASNEGIEFFTELAAIIKEMCRYSPHPISTLSNVSSLLFDQIPRLNWAGFYIYDGEKLIVGPFQGKPACTEIKIGKGVCGTAAEKMETMIVEDVNKFPGHIACDAESLSEVVAPIIGEGNKLLGVIDLDSPELNRFGSEFKQGMSLIAKALAQGTDFSKLV